VVGKLKAISAKVVFEEFPEARREIYGGELKEDGYFVRTVGDEVTVEAGDQEIQELPAAEGEAILGQPLLGEGLLCQ